MFEPRGGVGGNVDVVSVLAGAALGDSSALVRREAVYRVASLGREISRPILTRAMNDPDPGVARAAHLRVDTEVE